MQCAVMIEAAVLNDPTATQAEKNRVLEALKGAASKPRPIPITTEQVAAMMECHIVTVRRYGKQGLLHPIRITPRKIRWDKNEVEALMLQGAAA
ncbi:helix-turn-helix transcriptional regulator [Pontiella sulfatireligans]|uniref:Helix-turn-helix domain-containing protein n=1 Tax=Pontiella sulfatireligans TaxID=2750658 RepID=A0A6C2UQZ2_9BACT|nr:helix-turn-helix domain-containing protein [Pontiella sulfatireligans]VGO22715.1 hypothetical protein SCARR_04811 [Pontiella sulfatireligans]